MGVRASKLGKFLAATRSRLSLKKPRGHNNSGSLAPRGYVPICVGLENDTKRFMVHTTMLGDADFSELLCRSAEEFGFCNKGVLRIPCGAKDFEELMVKRQSTKPKVFQVKPVDH